MNFLSKCEPSIGWAAAAGWFAAILTVILLPGAVAGATMNDPTPAARATRVEPQLNVQIGPETDAVTFVNTNNDPFIYTRVYPLRHADPYEIRPYVMAAVRSRRVNSNDTKVEAIRYADGAGMLIVSAEDYRFEDNPAGISIGRLIEELDQPDLKSNAGRKFFLYFPKYYDAPSLATMLRQVALSWRGDAVELDGGIDAVRADTGLNALLLYTAPHSAKQIEAVLDEFDAPVTEALIEYRIYELASENDGSIGVDFQAWKNGPGADFFATGARYMSGWDILSHNVASNLIKESHTSFINFNPKWNSRYLDFLVARSKAHVVTEGRLAVMNRATGYIASVTRMPVIVAGEESAGTPAVISETLTVPEWGPAYTLNAVDQEKGLPIAIVPAGYDGEVTLARTEVNGRIYYNLALDHADARFVRADGVDLGRRAKAYDAAILYTEDGEVTALDDWNGPAAYRIAKDRTRESSIAEFGFNLTLTPEINNLQTIVRVSMSNTNLIGFKSNGEPRTTLSEFDTTLQVSHEGGLFYIGGLEKSEVVRSVNKVPLLGDIPGLGWIFSAENESVKRTQLVAVLSVTPLLPDTPVPPEFREQAEEIRCRVENFGIRGLPENEYGFDQFLLDPDKRSLE